MSGGKQVKCSVHGKASATFICRHLDREKKLGFNIGYSADNPDDLYPDAWCDMCDKVLEREGEWNNASEAFVNIKTVCSGCYQEIRENNWVQDEAAFKELVDSSFEYLQNIQDSFMENYHIGNHERWDWNQDTGKLIFSHDGAPVLECEIDFVGSTSSTSGTWMWAWANESFVENVKSRSREIRKLGDNNQFLKMACGLWVADEVDGWEMTAIMAKLTGAIGAYRAPHDNGFVYMVVNKASWVKPPESNNVVSLVGKK